MMITAVICLAMSLIPGKKKGQAVDLLTGGQAAGTDKNKKAFLRTNAGLQGTMESAMHSAKKVTWNDDQKVSEDMQRYRQSSFLRHVFVPAVGPGDRGIGKPLPWNGVIQETERSKIILFPGGLSEESVFREVKLYGKEACLQEDSG